METQPNFEYLCRVCAANTKGRNSVAECVYILRTPSLKDKIEKYLYFTISENDPLPKVLCKTCFRQVEATASLSKIAKHTQKVFRDFMVCTKPSAASAHYNIGIEPNPASTTTASDATCTASSGNYAREPPPHAMTAATIPADPSVLSPAAIHCVDDSDPLAELLRKDEVIVNVSINDPLTRENSHKMIHASQRRQNSLDSKFTPKSIAQRAFGSTPKTTASTGSLVKKSKKSSPAGVINFVNGLLQPQVTTLTSGGYVIGRMTTTTTATTGVNTTPTDTGTNVLQQKRKNLKQALNNIRVSNALASNNGQVSLLKSSQKSEASPPPQKQSSELIEAPKNTTDTVATQVSETLTGQVNKTSDTAAKRRTKSPHRSPVRTSPQRTSPQGVSSQCTSPQRTAAQATPLRRHSLAFALPPTPLPAPALPPPPPPQPVLAAQQHAVHPFGIPEDIILGRVIRDADLLKLILKALKWPVTKETMDTQIQRLRNSKFMEVMSDPNLLQDMDLTQILGPYLAPVYLAAQAIQQQQWAMASAAIAAKASAQQPLNTPAESAPNSEGQTSTAMPYKLPAETSVQLISVNGGANEEPPTTASKSQTPKRDVHKTQPKFVHPKKMRKLGASKNRDAIVISDEEAYQDSHSSGAAAIDFKRRMSKSSPLVSSKYNVELDPAFLAEYGICSAGDEDNSNEALAALLNRQRSAVSRQQRGHGLLRDSTTSTPAGHSNTCRDPAFNIEDIVLMEERAPQIENEEPPSDTFKSLATSTSASSVSTTQMSAFPLPTQLSVPLITRPIIKRRKTVIQASPARSSMNTESTNNTSTTASGGTAYQEPLSQLATSSTSTTASTVVSAQQISDASSVNVNVTQTSQATQATQVPSEILSIATQMPSTAKLAVPIKTYGTASTITTSSVKVGPSCVSLNTKKSSLPPGKQNRKLNPSKSALGQQLLEAIGLQKVDSHFEMQEEAAKSAGASAKQKRPKIEEPTVAHADSTTKSIVKEVLVEAKQKNTYTSCTEFDVEDQIDKITLHLQNNAKEQPPQDRKKVTTTPSDKKFHTATRIPNIRRNSTTVLKNRKSTSLITDQKLAELNASARMKAQSLAKSKESTRFYQDDNPTYAEDAQKVDLNSSATTTSSETNAANTPVVGRRKRGRKRNEEPKDPDPDFDPDRNLLKKDFLTFFVGDCRSRRKERVAAQVANQRVREIEDESAKKMEFEISTSSPTRPTRLSKTMSKYYKSPTRTPSAKRSPSGSRATKNRR